MEHDKVAAISDRVSASHPLLDGFPKPQVEDSCHVAAVHVDLPQFDAEDVDTWLLMCDNLLQDAGVRRQDTSFRKVLAKLYPEYFRIACLRQHSSIPPGEMLRRLDNLPTHLGDMKPSQVCTQFEALFPQEIDGPITRKVFLKRMPPPISSLCRQWPKTFKLVMVQGKEPILHDVCIGILPTSCVFAAARQPLGTHCFPLAADQLKWITGDKELFALYSAVKRFRHLLEGQQDLELCTDHKPLAYALTSKSERSARVQRQLAFLSEFSTDIRHIGGTDNVVSDCLSRPPKSVSAAAYEIGLSEYKEFAEEQQKSGDITALAANQSLRVQRRTVCGTSVPLLVDVSTVLNLAKVKTVETNTAPVPRTAISHVPADPIISPSPNTNIRSSRNRRSPAWFSDYVVDIARGRAPANGDRCDQWFNQPHAGSDLNRWLNLRTNDSRQKHGEKESVGVW
uniref:RT_RNaseH domain-containing protein n=1 Tax=Trichuris muris TaxID=70415 RepID=A0A5S6Q884_TRIMR